MRVFFVLISNVNLKLQVKEPRFEWTRDKMLVLREVTHADQGLYAIKLSSGFTYETVHLTVSGKSSILIFSLQFHVVSFILEGLFFKYFNVKSYHDKLWSV